MAVLLRRLRDEEAALGRHLPVPIIS